MSDLAFLFFEDGLIKVWLTDFLYIMYTSMFDLGNLTGFDWDESNREKNWEKHGVRTGECEEVFFNLPLLLRPDPIHSQKEPRYYVLGHTTAGSRLFIAFTVREDKVRVITARHLSKKERKIYEQENS